MIHSWWLRLWEEFWSIEKETFLRNVVMDLISLQDITIRNWCFLGLKDPDDVQLASCELHKDWCINLAKQENVGVVYSNQSDACSHKKPTLPQADISCMGRLLVLVSFSTSRQQILEIVLSRDHNEALKESTKKCNTIPWLSDSYDR